jgi:AcrR family transcriptional regulator
MATQPQPDPLIRPPLQRRSQESLERVLQAGANLLREVGYEGFTLQEVSARSEVSVGSIYARAASKEALILAIYDRETERMAQENLRIERASRR